MPQQLLLLGPFLAPICAAGAVVLWRDARVRALVAGYGVCAAIFLISGGRPDYTVALLLVLLAAGSGAALRWCTRPLRTGLLAAGLALNVALAVVVALPVLPQAVATRSVLTDIGPLLAGQTGWQELAAQTRALYALSLIHI